MGSVVPSWTGGLLDTDLKNVSVWFDDNMRSNTTKKEASSEGGRAHLKRRVNQITRGFPAQAP